MKFSIFQNFNFSSVEYLNVCFFLLFKICNFQHLTLFDCLKSGFEQCIDFSSSKFVPENFNFSSMEYLNVRFFLLFKICNFQQLTMFDCLKSGFEQCIDFSSSKFVPDFKPIQFLMCLRFDLARSPGCFQHISLFLFQRHYHFHVPSFFLHGNLEYAGSGSVTGGECHGKGVSWGSGGCPRGV